MNRSVLWLGPPFLYSWPPYLTRLCSGVLSGFSRAPVLPPCVSQRPGPAWAHRPSSGQRLQQRGPEIFSEGEAGRGPLRNCGRDIGQLITWGAQKEDMVTFAGGGEESTGEHWLICWRLCGGGVKSL